MGVARKVLISAQRSGRHRVGAQERVEAAALFLGQHFQHRLGTSGRRQDALHGRQAESAIAHGPFQSSLHVGPAIYGQQFQDALRLVPATAPRLDQPHQEAWPCQTQFGKALFQGGAAEPVIGLRLVLRLEAALPLRVRRQQTMPGDFRQVGAVDDQFVGLDPHRQQPADQSPGHRVQIRLPDHHALGRHVPIHHRGNLIGMSRQGQ